MVSSLFSIRTRHGLVLAEKNVNISLIFFGIYILSKKTNGNVKSIYEKVSMKKYL